MFDEAIDFQSEIQLTAAARARILTISPLINALRAAQVVAVLTLSRFLDNLLTDGADEVRVDRRCCTFRTNLLLGHRQHLGSDLHLTSIKQLLPRRINFVSSANFNHVLI